jgi:hypothetical protein
MQPAALTFPRAVKGRLLRYPLLAAFQRSMPSTLSCVDAFRRGSLGRRHNSGGDLMFRRGLPHRRKVCSDLNARAAMRTSAGSRSRDEDMPACHCRGVGSSLESVPYFQRRH